MTRKAAFAHLDKSARAVIRKSPEERLKWFQEQQIWIPCPKATEILSEMNKLIARPKRPRMRGLLIISESNNGKSRLASECVTRHPIDENPDGEHIIMPVLLLDMPPRPDDNAVLDELLTMLNQPFRRKGSVGDKRNQVITVWATACEHHRTVLLDRCGSCDSPYIPHRTAPSTFGRACCFHCGYDIARQSAPAAEGWELQMNAYFRQAALRGEWGGEAALPIFDGCRRLARVLLSVKWRDLAKEILGSALDSTCFANGTSVFEFQPLYVRRDVMRGIWVLIKNWPDRLVSAMRIAAVPRYAFDHEKHDMPLWLQYGLARVSPARPRLLHRNEVFEMCVWLMSQKHVDLHTELSQFS